MLSDSISTYSIPQLRFKDKNGNPFSKWEVKKLRDIAEYRRGSFPQPYGLPEWYDEINGVPFVQVFDVDNNMRLKEKTKQKISTKAMPMSVFVEKGSIVLTIQGSIGRIALTQYDAYVDRTLLIIRRLKIPLDKVFFMYVVSLLFDIEKRKAPGGTIKTITKEVLSDFEIQIPSLSEQQKIASFLSSIDDWIENLTQQKLALEKYKKGMMQKIFSQEVRFKDEYGKDFPKWEEYEIGECIEEYKEQSKTNNQYPVLTSSRSGLILQTEYFGEDNRITERDNTGFNLIPNNYLTYRSRSDDGRFHFNKNTLGVTGAISTYYPVFKMKNNENEFLIYYLNKKWKSLYKYSVGTSQKVLSMVELKKIKLHFPKDKEQQKIAHFLSSIDDLIYAKELQINKANQWKKGLMQKLFI